jgi:hypothetical protein
MDCMDVTYIMDCLDFAYLACMEFASDLFLWTLWNVDFASDLYVPLHSRI